MLRVGDRILQISGQDMRNASQTDFTNILKQCKDAFKLKIEYDVTTHGMLTSTGMCNYISLNIFFTISVFTFTEGLEETNGPLMVELQKPHGASLGISLSGTRMKLNYFLLSYILQLVIFITCRRPAGWRADMDIKSERSWHSRSVRIKGRTPWNKSSYSEFSVFRSGALHVGDRLISINSQQLEGRSIHEAQHILAHSNINVILEIMPSHNFSERAGGVSQVEDGLSDTSSRVSQSTAVTVPLEYDRKPSRCK